MQNDNSLQCHTETYVLDTSVLINNPSVIFELEGSNIIIPMEVLEELDNLKTRQDQTGAAARRVNRTLDGIRSDGNLFNGVELDGGQIVRVVTISDLSILPSGFKDNVDNKIISVAYRIHKNGIKVVCLSNDISLRVKCDAVGIDSREYTKTTIFDSDNYMGLRVVEATKFEIDDFYKDGLIDLGDLELYPNEGVLLKSESSSGLGIANENGEIEKLRYAGEKGFNVQGIKPRSKEQVIALELLMDPDIHMVTMSGKAGCGKTLLAVAAALDHVFMKRYNKLIISRPVQSMSKDIGFLPGTKQEKMAPWLQPIFDNCEVILSKKGSSYIQMMMDKGQLEVEALSHIRGRTLPNTIFIIDEAQNITHHEAKAILTRMGEGSKVILIGDLDQIDSTSVSESTSGLASVVNLFKEFGRSGHVELIKGERSELATFASDVM